jgi:hypothetical protein
MIQFNLLPDVKLEYIRAKRMKRTVMLLSLVVSGAAVALVVILALAVLVFQKKYMNDLSRDIDRGTAQLKSVKDLDKILTVQNQLSSLPQLHDQKPVASRMFGFVEQVTPANLSISNMSLNFEDQSMQLKGAAPNLETVNKFVDTLKFTTYQVDGKGDSRSFSEVVLAGFSRDDKAATYEITLKFDPAIFDTKNTIKLVVPNIITTRSETEKPDALFQTTN